MKAGDYVKVKWGFHDSNMPRNRRDGLIVQVVGNNDQVVIMFSNGAFLKFHKSQVEVINECLGESR